MKKSKLLPKDGSEFTIFFLKENNADIVVSNNLNEMDVNENSAAPQTLPMPYASLVDDDSPAFPPLIDDAISSDHVENPVAGKIYKIKGLNIVGRFKGSTVPHGSAVALPQFHLSVHGTSVYINQNDNILLKASRREVEIYLNIDEQ